MNIEIQGYLDRNFGDDLMMRMAAMQLCEHNLYINENRKELLIPLLDIPNVYDMEFHPNINIDVILRVTGSGFVIRSKTGCYFALRRIFKNYLKRGPKSAVISCNVGPFYNRFAKFISDIELRQYSLVTTREQKSLEYVEKVFKKNAYLYPDILFSLPDSLIPERTNENCLGISVYRRSGNNLSFYKQVAEIADFYINETGRKVILFAFDVEMENDLAGAYTALDMCENKDMIEIIAHTDNGTNIINGFVRCEKIIGVRFHSIVLALRIGIPCLPVIYTDKTANLLDDLGYDGDRYYINDLDVSGIKNKIISERLPFKLDKKVIDDSKNHIRRFEEFVWKSFQ